MIYIVLSSRYHNKKGVIIKLGEEDIYYEKNIHDNSGVSVPIVGDLC